jgi:uncharacterized protein YfiM (DUF2279 family)
MALLLLIVMIGRNQGGNIYIPGNGDSVYYTHAVDTVKNPIMFSDPWVAPDKGLHLVGSMIMMIGSSQYLMQHHNKRTRDALYIGGGFTFSLGLLKEIRDNCQDSNRFSYKDLIADAIGITIGGILSSLE